MRWSWLVLVVLGAGCSQILGVNDVTLGDGGKQPGGDGSGGGSACIQGAGPMNSLFAACFQTLPAGDVTVSSAIDTDTDMRCSVQHQMMNGPDVCVIAGGTLTVNNTVRVTGSHPLVLVATTDLTVNGTLDLRGTAGQPAPAGVGTGACVGPGTGSNGAGAGGAGGGGGGGFGVAGGAGGAGTAPGGTSGNGDSPPLFIRGGCNGAAGGQLNGGGEGMGGLAGGAVYLLANNSIDVTDTGIVTAAGGGGKGAGGAGGGGGGGASGGLVGLDAPTVSVEGSVLASGGGGGGGGTSSANGLDGSTGSSNPGAGGTGGGGGAGTGGTGGGIDGNDNDLSPTLGQVGSTACACGGGGGGGAYGVIWMNYMAGVITGTIVPNEIPQ